MSGLARIYHQDGMIISGSDQYESHTTYQLIQEGIKIHIGHHSNLLPVDTNLVIYSSAIPKDNPERIRASQLGIKQISYPEAVGSLTKKYSTISVCGTHGKTTTSGMLAAAFLACAQDPTVLIGSSTEELGHKNARYGRGRHLILESCEHFRNFLHYKPKNIIVTNIELDHLDYYKDSHDYINAFVEFFNKLPANGLIVANGDDPGVRKAISRINKKTVFYGGKKHNHYQIINHDLYYKGKKIFSLKLAIPGVHNISNAAGVFAMCHELKMNLTHVGNALLNFKGAARRFQIKGYYDQTLVIDDYAHHPTEIASTINAVREKYGQSKKILCVFQPHQFSRTRFFLEDFPTAFTNSNSIIISDIMRVRDNEQDVASISAPKLVDKISTKHPSVIYGGDLDNTLKIIKTQAKSFDIILILGAGDIWKIADTLTKTTNHS